MSITHHKKNVGDSGVIFPMKLHSSHSGWYNNYDGDGDGGDDNKKYLQKPSIRARRERIMMLAWLMSARNTASCKYHFDDFDYNYDYDDDCDNYDDDEKRILII